MKFLVVDDEVTSRLILDKILGEHGEVHHAVNGQEATDAVKQALEKKFHYNLITLDVIMPDMDGHETLIKVRQLERDHGILHSRRARVIMTTTLGDGKSITSAFRNQCDGYLVKPIELNKLIAEIQKCIGSGTSEDRC